MKPQLCNTHKAESDYEADMSVRRIQRRKIDEAEDKDGETKATKNTVNVEDSVETPLDREQKKKKISRRARVREANPVFIAAGLISPPKGIYSTKNGTFRIQISLDGLKKRKFSKNVDSLEQAMWLYEIKMLASDKPLKIENLILESNYNDFVLLGLCTSRADYIEKLFSNIGVLLNDSKITEDEAKEAKAAHQNMCLDDVVLAEDRDFFCFMGDPAGVC